MSEAEEILKSLEKLLLKLVCSLSIILLITLIAGNVLDYHDKKEKEKYLQSNEYKQLIEKQKKCEHNFVTTGSGSRWSVKIYSKCSKCGKTIK